MWITAVQIYQRHISCLNSSKGAVYCKSRTPCEEMAQHLGYRFYQAGMDTEGRANGVERWLSNGGFIAATFALVTGLDYPNIVDVINVGVRCVMTDFAQD